ncbi:Fc.00g089970.m01.CDS01 [Cosmosporella sp. VM-42]
MARKDKAAPVTPTEEKPLPETRPGTSGTEMLLMTNRRQASVRYQKAHRAEKAYRAKKRATAARQDFHDARGHFKESARHFGTGLKMVFGVVKSVPYIFGEKREARRELADQKKKTKALEKKKKLEERIARDEGETEEGTESKKLEGSS